MSATSIASRPSPPGAARTDPFVERFSLASARERWPDFLPLEHETLPLPAGFAAEEDRFLVSRRPPPGRPIREGRVPRSLVPQLLLQAASAMAFFQAHGFSLGEEDLAAAHWERQNGSARLWLAGSPSGIARDATGPGACAVLCAFLDRLARRGGRIADREAQALAERLGAAEARLRRAEFAVAAVLRSFPSLSGRAAAPARRRAAGFAGSFLRDVHSRAVIEAGRAILEGRQARLFLPGGSALDPGSALGLEPAPSSSADASRRLRELARAEAARGRAAWIAAGLERWDPLSRRAFETAARFLPVEIEVRRVPGQASPPRLPDEWRREVFVPCGTMAAALRFYEWLDDEVRDEPGRAREMALDCLASDEWAAFASDPTGQAPLPAPRARAASCGAPDALGFAERQVLTLLAPRETALGAAPIARLLGRSARPALSRLSSLGHVEAVASGWKLTPSGRRGVLTGPAAAAVSRRCAERETDPARRIDLLLAAGAVPEALEAGERWRREDPSRPAEAWFELAARLSAAGAETPPWLALIEAEREVAGGRPAEALAILDELARCGSAGDPERREAGLRAAEIGARVEGPREGGRRAAAWRGAFPRAPEAETVRALRLEAAGLARGGRREEAFEKLDEADRLAAGLEERASLENALCRAAVLSLGGRFAEEARLYGRWREEAVRLGDDALVARFFSQEALGLSDRREFSRAAARLEEAFAVLRDDPAERARVSIDLAATLYHAGRPGRCAGLLEEAAELAACAGRRDLLRIARSNRIELWVARGQWQEACAAAEEMLAAARAEGDDLWRMVALHHRSRVALRRGMLGRAAEDNARARELAERLADRLEIGELWLEEGDRSLYEGDLDRARRAWERAAEDPPDRCDTERVAARRLEELAWSAGGGPPEAAREALALRLSAGDYEAAETAARWRVLFADRGMDEEVARRADQLLRERGGEALADRIFGRCEPVASAGSIPDETVRRLREALARAMAGNEASESLAQAGIAGLVLEDADGKTVLSVGRVVASQARSRLLEAGAARYRLTLPREVPEALAACAALLAETLLFRPPASPSSEGFAEGWRRFGIVTEDASMEEPYGRLNRFSTQPVTVLVRGESGSGKEAVARAVHALSPRASGPFVAVNVPAIPAALLESELFGHARGAFTGAERDRVGLMEEAARGTLFFDEIGDLAPALQAKLLRALQDREIRRLGENRSRRVDVRVVSATSRDLARDVEAGRFREDLYYRLNVAVIALPPLRDRGRDVLLLARHFLEAFGRGGGARPPRLSPEAALALSAHGWPGNVRELQNAMAQGAALADPGGVVGLEHLPEAVRSARTRAPVQSYRSRLDAHRKGMISDALERARGNRSLAARELGLSRQALRYLMKELNVKG
ncbi:MAG: sigma 54-interacting transcriptional regulator [Acidobacteriota bacterium]